MFWRQFRSKRIILLDKEFRYNLNKRNITGFVERRLDVIERKNGGLIHLSRIDLGFQDSLGEPYVSVPSTFLSNIKPPTRKDVLVDSLKLFNLYLQPKASINIPFHFVIPDGKIYSKESSSISLIEERDGLRRIVTNLLLTYIFRFFAVIDVIDEHSSNLNGLALDGIGLYQIEYSYGLPLRKSFIPFPTKENSSKYFREIA